MIIGAHAIVFSRDPEADRAFMREALGLPHVDVGGGWLIFGLPPSEVAVHDADEEAGKHELYLMCANVEAFVQDMQARGVPCSDVRDLGWGSLVEVTLPGGGKLGVYQPRHARPEPRRAAPPRAPKKKKAAAKKKSAAKPAKKSKKAAKKKKR